MIITTSAVALIWATRGGTPISPCSQADSGAEKAASPTMPFRMPIDVMPTWIDDPNLGAAGSDHVQISPSTEAPAIARRKPPTRVNWLRLITDELTEKFAGALTITSWELAENCMRSVP